MPSIEDRLAQLGIDLPTPMAPVANYVPFVINGTLLSISGQVATRSDGTIITGKIGQDLDLEAGQTAAQRCAINILAQARAACGGDLERIDRIIKLGGFVNCVDGYPDQPKVINGASDLMVEVLGEAGRHSRSAVGVNALPLNAAVEIDALIALKP